MPPKHTNRQLQDSLGVELCSQWHPTLNLPKTLNELEKRSESVWWLGKCGHEWETRVSNRLAGSSCQICSGKKILIGFNDFESQNPTPAKEWHPTKNGNLLPTQVFARSSKIMVWWLCNKGHSFKMKPLHRAYGHSCGYCSGMHSVAGENDLETTHPDFIKNFWHPTLNLPLLPSHKGAGSGTLVWWVCEKGHATKTAIYDKVKGENKCGYCANKILLVGFNDLQSANPTLAAQWHPAKNGNLLPSQICVGNTGNKAISWLCDKGHDWTGSVSARSNSKHGCPYCSGNRIWVGYNDLATLNPILASEWHPTKNNLLTPKEYAGTSGKSVWWLGKCGHEWKAQISNRKNGAGCNTCGFIEGARKNARLTWVKI